MNLSTPQIQAHLSSCWKFNDRNVSKRMWLPTPIYERIPQFYFLVGLLFITDGVYLGFEMSISFYYIGLGFACCAYGVALYVMRKRYRQERSATDTAAAPADDSAPDAPAIVGESVA